MLIRPMLCELGSLSLLESLDGNPDWIAETKYDGERLVAQHDQGKVHLWTRRDISVSHKFPEVVTAFQEAVGRKRHTVVDGELIVGTHLKDLARRQTEDKLAIRILSRKMPATYMVFDVIFLDGKDVRSVKLSERKEMLRRVFEDTPNLKHVPYFDSRGLKGRFDSFVQQGREGMIVKHLASAYQADKRSRDWLKFKKSVTLDVDIIGAVRSEAGQAFKSLIMVREGRYFGLVGTGFTEEDRRRILAELSRDRVDKPMVPIPEGVDPVVLTHPRKAVVKVLEISNTGMPRAPVWVGFSTPREPRK